MQYVQAFLSVHGAGGYTKHLKIIEYVGFDTGKAGFCGCEIVRFNGKGLVSKKQTGDLYAVLKIVMPPKPDENTAALWQQLADAQSSFDPRKDWGKA